MDRIVRMAAIVGTILGVLGAVGVAAASAANFQVNEPGTMSGSATTVQVLTVSGGQIRCTGAATAGTVEQFASETQKVTVNYSGCTAFGFTGAVVSPAEYMLHANGVVDVLNTITVTVPGAGCSVMVGPQAGLTTIAYTNSGGKVKASSSIAGISYATTGGLCGPGGVNGTFTGASELALIGGGGFVAVLLGGTLSKEVTQNKAAVKVCEFKKAGEPKENCQIKLKVTGAGEGWRVEKVEWKGAEPEVRYKKAKAECTKGTLLKNGESCTDEIEMIKLAAGTENEWCVVWELEGGAFTGVPFCTKLKM